MNRLGDMKPSFFFAFISFAKAEKGTSPRGFGGGQLHLYLA